MSKPSARAGDTFVEKSAGSLGLGQGDSCLIAALICGPDVFPRVLPAVIMSRGF